MIWIFLDASGIIALLNKSDNLHARAKQVYMTFISPEYRFLTTDLILVGVGNVLSQPKFKQAVAGCPQAFTNDHHFIQAGFSILLP